MTGKLTKHQISGIRKGFEEKRNRTKMKERLKAKRIEKQEKRRGWARRNKDTMELIDEFLTDSFADSDDDGEVGSNE